MGGHKVRQRVLIFVMLFITGVKPLQKLLIHRMLRFSHKMQHLIGNMLRGYPELAADVVFH